MKTALVLSAVTSILSLLISVIALWLQFDDNLLLSLLLSWLYGMVTGLGVAIGFKEYMSLSP